LTPFFQSKVEGFSHAVLFCWEALDRFLLVHYYLWSREVTSEHVPLIAAERRSLRCTGRFSCQRSDYGSLLGFPDDVVLCSTYDSLHVLLLSGASRANTEAEDHQEYDVLENVMF